MEMKKLSKDHFRRHCRITLACNLRIWTVLVRGAWLS